jgi:hypothetical protein
MSLSLMSKNGYGVSCFGGNDGEVTSAGTGGIAFESGGPYLYAANTKGYTDNPQLSDLPPGEHTFYIRDANGCVESKTLNLSEPQALNVSLLNKEDVRCFGDFSGQMALEATGGVGQYWYTLDGDSSKTEPYFSNISAGSYEVAVEDANGCVDSEWVEIEELNDPLVPQGLVQHVSCYDYANGSISLFMLGGDAPFTYEWSNGATSAEVSNLDTGTYSVRIIDAADCMADTSFQIMQPENVDVGENVMLCLGQTHTLDATYPNAGASYYWSATNGFSASSAVVDVQEAGQYWVEVVLPDGCVMRDQMMVETSDVLFEVNFLAASEIYEGDTLVVVDVSTPEPDSIHWHFGGDLLLVDSSSAHPQLQYPNAGIYDIGIIAYHSGCRDQVQKTVSVYQKDEIPDNGRIYFGEAGIRQMVAYPNPTSGQFEVRVELYRTADVEMVLYDLYGEKVAEQSHEGRDFYLTGWDISGHQNGIYLLHVVAQDEEQVLKLILR